MKVFLNLMGIPSCNWTHIPKCSVLLVENSTQLLVESLADTSPGCFLPGCYLTICRLGLPNLWKSSCSHTPKPAQTENTYMCVCVYIYIYVGMHVCVYIYKNIAVNWIQYRKNAGGHVYQIELPHRFCPGHFTARLGASPVAETAAASSPSTELDACNARGFMSKLSLFF